MKNLNNKQIALLLLGLLLAVAAPLILVQSEKMTGKSETPAPKQEIAPASVNNIAAPAKQTPRAMTFASNTPSTVRKMWLAPTETLGTKLDPRSPAFALAARSGKKIKGRKALLEVQSMASPSTLREGDVLTIPLLGGEEVEGVVQLVLPEANGVVRVGGKLTGSEVGTFSLTQLPDRVTGRILLSNRKVAFLITPGENDSTWLVEKPLSEVLCVPYPQATAKAAAAPTSATATAAVPVLSSRPTAPAVIFLDFDGATVTDPDWDGGATIIAKPYVLTAAQITAAWNRVKEDYLPFNVDVTTNPARYDNTASGRRMRCIITPNDVASPGAGGVAYVDSFSEAGSNYSSTVPCWVFNDAPDTIAAAVAHEVGHTLGLSHDGRTSPVEDYFDGHGTGAVSWGPIMGSGYYSSLTQWSKGEYASANNHEDDLAIISSTKNNFGYAGDEAGNFYTTAIVLGRSGSSINQSGIIQRTGDSDCFAFNTGACTVNITARRASPAPNLDIRLDLLNSAGTVIATANPDGDTNATLSRAVSSGAYFVRITGTGRGNVLADGYSNYGSLGVYGITGSIPGAAQVPYIISSGTSAAVVAKAFSYRILATNTPGSYSVLSALPPGLTLNASTGYITGTPSRAGNYSTTMRATNPIGTGVKTLTISVASGPLPVISSAGTAAGVVGSAFRYQITATNSPTSYRVAGTLPAGLALNATTGLISGTPSAAVTSSVTIAATNVGGSGTKALTFTIQPRSASLANALEATSNSWTTSGNAVWKVITSGSYDGVDAARSGVIGNEQQSSMQTTVTGPITLSFRWKVDSESGYDFLRFNVDGVQKASISGNVAWQARNVSIPSGNHTVQWVYEKDYSEASGADAGFVDTVTIPRAAK